MSTDAFRKRMRAAGANLREERIRAIRANLAQTFFDDPSYVGEVKEYWTGGVYHPRVYESKNKAAGTVLMQFLTQHNEPFGTGDVFTLPSGESWICTYKPETYGMFHLGTIDFCNYALSLHVGGKDRQYPVCVQNATQYNSGETRIGQLGFGSSQSLIFITAMPETIALDHGYRFLIDRNQEKPTAYRLTQIDHIHSYKGCGRGVLRWTVAEDMLRPTDDIANMVADQAKGEGGEWF